MPLESTAS